MDKLEKDFLTGNEQELSDEELEGVIGGSGGMVSFKSGEWFCKCPLCGKLFGYKTYCSDKEISVREHFWDFHKDDGYTLEQLQQKFEETLHTEIPAQGEIIREIQLYLCDPSVTRK